MGKVIVEGRLSELTSGKSFGVTLFCRRIQEAPVHVLLLKSVELDVNQEALFFIP